MVRKVGATDKKGKGSQRNETHMAGITTASDFIQEKMAKESGIKLDQHVNEYSHLK
ncbi:hypothetical protein [Desulforamulus reducens]|uniref:hypothetical protein n=1 Tax=Desulforamulus reducens TaxID=59610 RepID=UPI0002DBFCBA|nr:hypothetical protein [Desulforamulus reducens]